MCCSCGQRKKNEIIPKLYAEEHDFIQICGSISSFRVAFSFEHVGKFILGLNKDKRAIEISSRPKILLKAIEMAMRLDKDFGRTQERL